MTKHDSKHTFRRRGALWLIGGSLAVIVATAATILGTGAEPASAQPPSAASQPDFTPTGQWSLGERQYWQRLQQELDRRTRALSERCGSRITATYVHESFRGRLTEGGSFGLSGYARATCDAPLDVMFTMCTNSELAKEAIQQSIRHVECEWGETRYSRANGTIRFRFDTEERNASSYGDHFRTWLEQNL